MSNVLAAVIPEPGAAVELREVPPPDLEPDSGVLAIQFSEVCGTDVHLQDGRLAGVPYPLIPGHVSAGCVAKIRGRLMDVHGQALREGDRITFLDVHGTCNACWYCLVAKASTRCPRRRVYGVTYGLQDGLSGGWAQQLYLKPGTRCIRLDGVDCRSFMAGGCSLPTALHAVDRAAIAIAESVLVLGSGPVGLSCIIFARLAGAVRVLCLGAPDARLQTALEVGASAVLNFEKHSLEERLDWVREQTQGRGADVSIEAAGAPSAAVEAMRFTRDAGRVVVVGQYTDHGSVPFNPHLDLNRKHLEVRGCWGSDFSHFYRGIQVLSDPQASAPWKRIPLRGFPLTQAQRALQSVRQAEVVKALIEVEG